MAREVFRRYKEYPFFGVIGFPGYAMEII